MEGEDEGEDCQDVDYSCVTVTAENNKKIKTARTSGTRMTTLGFELNRIRAILARVLE